MQRGPKGPHSRGPLSWAVPLLSQPQFLPLTRPECREWSGALLCLGLLSYICMHSDPIGNASHVPEGSHSVCAVWTWRLAFLLLFSFPASLLSGQWRRALTWFSGSVKILHRYCLDKGSFICHFSYKPESRCPPSPASCFSRSSTNTQNKNVYSNAHGSIVHSHQKVKTTPISISR